MGTVVDDAQLDVYLYISQEKNLSKSIMFLPPWVSLSKQNMMAADRSEVISAYEL